MGMGGKGEVSLGGWLSYFQIITTDLRNGLLDSWKYTEIKRVP